MPDLPADEWLRQAHYDLATARLLFEDGRFSYAVFFAHLALEKALKGCYLETHARTPPVSHSLRHLAAQSGLPLTDDQRTFLNDLNEASVLNLYPDRLFAAGVSYDGAAARDLLDRAAALLDWIFEQSEFHP